MNYPYANDQEALLFLVQRSVNGINKLYSQAHSSKKAPAWLVEKISRVTLELQDNMDRLTPENYIYAFNNILTPDMRSFMRETPVMYLPPLRPFFASRKNRRSIVGGNGDSNIVNTRTPYNILNSPEFSSYERFPEAIPLILDKIADGADVNETRDGKPLLHRVFRYLQLYQNHDAFEDVQREGVISIITQLLNRGADIDSVDSEGLTMLENTLRDEYHTFADIQLLLDLGATVTLDIIINSLDVREQSTFRASYMPRKTLLLLNSASDLVLNQLRNYIDETGGNFLHLYVSILPFIFGASMGMGRYQSFVAIRSVIQKLLGIGINPEAKNSVGQTPARLAMNMGFPDIADWLTSHHNNRRTRNIYGISNTRANSLAANQRTRRAATRGSGRRRYTRRR